MAIKEFWIQIENHAWDVNPHNINRMTSEVVADADKVAKTLKSPPTNATQAERTVEMAGPVTGEALILRRYAPPQQADKSDAWTVPDDRKVNPWDLNEPDPTDSGTMGTIPGATIACNVGDNGIVHFRNMDLRTHLVEKTFTINIPLPFGLGTPFTFTIKVPEPLPVEERAHSLHPHGIVFAPEPDGSYPLSPRDEDQPVGAEAALWAHPSLDVDDFKKGDRVPPEATFDYKWDTFGWPSTAGVWLYHDHSICDHDNVLLGAIGTLVIHNEADDNDVPVQDLPGGEHNGSLTRFCRFPVDLPQLGDFQLPSVGLRPLAPPLRDKIKVDSERELASRKGKKKKANPQVAVDRLHIFEGNIVELAADKNVIVAFFQRCYVEPPQRALYLQLYHEMPGVGMCINGRKYLGNTPTLIGGLDTKMRFGLVAMNDTTFHTFHLHAHRWVIPGPAGGNVGGSPPGGPGVQRCPPGKGSPGGGGTGPV